MNKEEKELLRKFQCDYNRMMEEVFAQTLAENEEVRVFFINENQAFTDGINIVTDPAIDEFFTDKRALRCTCDFLHWPGEVWEDPWNVLRLVTRAQTIHECLHILYTDFPGRHIADPKCNTRNKKIVMGLISNIIEDAYIEAVGCSYFDNMEVYLKFGRVSRLFSNRPALGTVDRMLREIGDKKGRFNDSEAAETKISARTNIEKLKDYLNYMVIFLLYPMIKQEPPVSDIALYVEESRELFWAGSAVANPKERYEFAKRIFDLIVHIIPEDTEGLDVDGVSDLLGGVKTHGAVSGMTGNRKREGRHQAVSERLFTDNERKIKKEGDSTAQIMQILKTFAREKADALDILDYEGSFMTLQGRDYECSAFHKNIRINEKHLKINLHLRKAYQNIYSRYKINILSYGSHFRQILHAKSSQKEEKKRYGSEIVSARLGDIRKRYWSRTVQGEDVPDLAIMLLIDGSGSMFGERKKAAVHSSIILHEVLKDLNIPHAVVEHRASFEKPEIDVNVLLRFQGREEEKLNLLRIEAHGDNRDGLALFWAERYMERNAGHEYRVIIVVSDGCPAHMADNYFPPVSSQDTANAVRKITKRGTSVIAVSLDAPEQLDCYDRLSKIYPNLVACNDMKRLAGTLLGVIANLL